MYDVTKKEAVKLADAERQQLHEQATADWFLPKHPNWDIVEEPRPDPPPWTLVPSPGARTSAMELADSSKANDRAEEIGSHAASPRPPSPPGAQPEAQPKQDARLQPLSFGSSTTSSAGPSRGTPQAQKSTTNGQEGVPAVVIERPLPRRPPPNAMWDPTAPSCKALHLVFFMHKHCICIV